jgi:hypothetical protein
MHPQPSRAGLLALNGKGPRVRRRLHPAEILTILILLLAVQVSRYTAKLSTRRARRSRG